MHVSRLTILNAVFSGESVCDGSRVPSCGPFGYLLLFDLNVVIIVNILGHTSISFAVVVHVYRYFSSHI